MKSIPKVSLFIINVLLALVLIAFILSLHSVYKMYTPLEKPLTTEGMVNWKTFTGLNVHHYSLTKVLEYDGTAFSEYYMMAFPSPKVQAMSNDSESELKIISKNEDFSPFLEEKSYPLTVKIEDDSLGKYYRNIFMGIFFLFWTFTIFWFLILRKFLITVSQKAIFDRDNISRLLYLGFTILALPLFQVVSKLISSQFLMDNFQIQNGGWQYDLSINTVPIIVGIIFLILALTIYEGSKLKEENELTI